MHAQLLMDSLGGSALALMIACCSPTAAHVEETLSTLNYATRAKNIRNRPVVQVRPRVFCNTLPRSWFPAPCAGLTGYRTSNKLCERMMTHSIDGSKSCRRVTPLTLGT